MVDTVSIDSMVNTISATTMVDNISIFTIVDTISATTMVNNISISLWLILEVLLQ